MQREGVLTICCWIDRSTYSKAFLESKSAPFTVLDSFLPNVNALNLRQWQYLSSRLADPPVVIWTCQFCYPVGCATTVCPAGHWSGQRASVSSHVIHQIGLNCTGAGLVTNSNVIFLKLFYLLGPFSFSDVFQLWFFTSRAAAWSK